MPITHTIKHKKPSADTTGQAPTTAFQERIDHYESTGQLIFTVVDHDELNTTITMVFPSEEDERIVFDDPIWNSFNTNIQDNYANKGIEITSERVVS